MFTEIIVRHCAPTLAGLKVSNLFSCRYSSMDELINIVYKNNLTLNPKGVNFVILKAEEGKALILTYREKHLEKILARYDIREFLSRYGYTKFEIEDCFNVLKEHLLYCDFPHEIGVFLGYPLEDVKAFIENKGANSKCVGCWKVYTNVQDAQKIFNRFKKCTNIYCKKFEEGFHITRLTVAG